MKTIFITTCSSTKKGGKAPAQELYTGTCFNLTKELIASKEKNPEWYILSSKYGLLRPNQEIETYDAFLGDLPSEKRKEWAQGVVDELKKIIGSREVKIIWLASGQYLEYVAPLLDEMKITKSQEFPLKGKSLGYQLQWLKKEVQGSKPSDYSKAGKT